MCITVYEPMLEDHISEDRYKILCHFFWINPIHKYLLSIIDFAASNELHHYQPFRRKLLVVVRYVYVGIVDEVFLRPQSVSHLYPEIQLLHKSPGPCFVQF